MPGPGPPLSASWLCLCRRYSLPASTGFALVSTQACLTLGLRGAPSMCCHFKGCCSSPSQPALAAFGLLPRLQHPAWLVSPPNPSCSFPVVLLAEGMLRWGGGAPSPWPLFSLLHQLTAKYPWGLVREGFSLIFFSNGNNSTTCQRDFCMHLFSRRWGLTSSLRSFPAS